MKHYLLSILFLVSWIHFSQTKDYYKEDIVINNYVEGTLLQVDDSDNSTLVIIIPDSGPTDRNGNQNFQNNNALKKLAEALIEQGVSSFRYDKRSVKQLRKGRVDLKTSFEDFVSDAKEVIQYFSEIKPFNKLYVLGHGQGSLVGLLSVDERVDGFISVAGAGRSLDKILIDEVTKTAPSLVDDTKRILGLLTEGKTTSQYPQALSSIFDLELQPFMISWIKYDPIIFMESLQIPSLVINGTKDLQVNTQEAEALANSNSKAELVIIDDMNHVLVLISGDDLENSKSYNEAHRKLSKILIDTITGFVQK